MYQNNTDKDLINAAVTAALGAGAVTSFAVSQGQNPFLALAITGIAVFFTVICYKSGLI